MQLGKNSPPTWPAGSDPARPAYRPENCGSRRSRDASIPSRKSSVPISRSCSSRSCSMAARELVGQAGSKGVPDRSHRQGRRPGDLLGQGVGPGPRVIGKAIAQADAQGLGPVDATAGVEQLERPLSAHRPRQGDRQPEALVEPEACEVGGESAVRSADPEVGGEGETEAAPDGAALYRRHDGQGTARQRLGVVVERPERHRIGGSRGGKVQSGAEVASLRAQHHGSASLSGGPVDAFDQGAQQRGVEVVGWRTVHLHFGHMVFRQADGDIGEGVGPRLVPSRQDGPRRRAC